MADDCTTNNANSKHNNYCREKVDTGREKVDTGRVDYYLNDY